jgi:glycosyltransferase involved in cell wall biosynthesis
MIPSGVDEQAFQPGASNNETVKIFLPGRANDPLKGMETLIQACDILQNEGVTFEVHYTAAMDCPSQRHWLINRGWVNQSQLAALYHEMDIAVVPSLWIEPFGITALEGMSSGIPVIASKTGGLAHSVVHGETGYHMEPGNVNELADALRKLIQDKDYRKQLGSNGRKRIEEHYAWDRILDNHYMPMIETYLSQQKTAVQS